MRQALAVFRKELLDALRDRRTLLMVLLSSVAIGPLVLPYRCLPVRSRSARSCAVARGPVPAGNGCRDGANQFWPGITPPVTLSPKAPQRLRGA